MIQNPPIDKLVEKTGNKYTLAVGAAKRARQIIEQPQPLIVNPEMRKPLSAAAYEIYEGKVKFVND